MAPPNEWRGYEKNLFSAFLRLMRDQASPSIQFNSSAYASTRSEVKATNADKMNGSRSRLESWAKSGMKGAVRWGTTMTTMFTSQTIAR